MDSNSSAPAEPPTGGGGGDDSSQSLASPVSILPLVISITTLVTIVVIACVLWRRRQKRRARELARQLTATQRRINTLRALREKEMSAGSRTKAEYHPPTDLQASLSSVDDVSLHRVRLARNGPGRFSLNHEEPLPEGCKSAGASLPPTISENESSFQCSTCRDSSTVFTGSHVPVHSSMAVECDTTNPSISSVGAWTTAQKERLRPRKLPQGITDTSALSMSNAGTWGSSSTLQPSNTHLGPSTPSLCPRRGTAPLWEDVTFDPSRPNTPVTTASEDSVVDTVGHESDGQEKWV